MVVSATRAAKRRQTKGRAPVAMMELELSERDAAVCDAIEDADDDDLHPQMRGYTREQIERTFDAIAVQNSFMDMLRLVKYPIDERGRTYDLRFLDLGGSKEAVLASGPSMGGSVMRAIFYTMTLLGFRRTCSKCGHHEKSWIKPRVVPGTGGMQTWVDIRKPDTAEEELSPEHKQSMINLPPDVRALAAKRDGEDGLAAQVEWHTKANIEFVDAPRPEDWDQ